MTGTTKNGIVVLVLVLVGSVPIITKLRVVLL